MLWQNTGEMMINKIKNLRGIGLRLGDINTLLNDEGFYLPWNEKQMDQFFRNTKKEMTTASWSDAEGNRVRLIFTMQNLEMDLFESTLIVVESEYFTIEEIVEQIRRQLHSQM